MPTLSERFSTWERGMRARYNTDFSTPENAKRARFFMRWLDHEILRHWWKNFHEIAPGAFRSNHPTEERFRAFTDMGIKTILNLRGTHPTPYYRLEVALCQELGLTLISHPMSASIAPSRDTMLGLINTLRTIEHPFVMHCKSGADRTGLASAVYLMVIKDAPVAEAQKMLSLRYIHLNNKKTGILDHILDCYADDQAAIGIKFEAWVATIYDHEKITASFKRRLRGAAT